jgi:uncharacterized membrane protein
MNAIAIRYLVVVLALVAISLLFSWIANREYINKVKQAVAWLLKISFFDFVELVIFLKPLKKRYRETGIVVWLVLVFFVGKYLIFTQPKLAEIPGPYIPMIGYVFYLSILFIFQFVLLISRKPERDADEEN